MALARLSRRRQQGEDDDDDDVDSELAADVGREDSERQITNAARKKAKAAQSPKKRSWLDQAHELIQKDQDELELALGQASSNRQSSLSDLCDQIKQVRQLLADPDSADTTTPSTHTELTSRFDTCSEMIAAYNKANTETSKLLTLSSDLQSTEPTMDEQLNVLLSILAAGRDVSFRKGLHRLAPNKVPPAEHHPSVLAPEHDASPTRKTHRQLINGRLVRVPTTTSTSTKPRFRLTDGKSSSDKENLAPARPLPYLPASDLTYSGHERPVTGQERAVTAEEQWLAHVAALETAGRSGPRIRGGLDARCGTRETEKSMHDTLADAANGMNIMMRGLPLSEDVED